MEIVEITLVTLELLSTTLFQKVLGVNDYLEVSLFGILLVLCMLIIVLLFILMAAFLTLYERQTLAAIQRRKGPNVVGFMGLLQAFADAFKLLFKEQSITISSSKIFFIGSSLYVVLFSLFV